MTVVLIIAALVVSVAPALGAAILAVNLTPGFGPVAADRSGKLAVAAFIAVYGLSAWLLIAWVL